MQRKLPQIDYGRLAFSKYASLWMEARAVPRWVDRALNRRAEHDETTTAATRICTEAPTARERVRAFILHQKVRGALEEQEGSSLRRNQLRKKYGVDVRFAENPTYSGIDPRVFSSRRLTFSFDGIYADFIFDDEKCATLIEDALAGSRLHIQVVDEIVDEFTAQGRPLTVALARYVNERLKLLRETAPRKRGKPRVTEERDIMISFAVYDTHKVYSYGLSVSAETKGEPTPSAPEIVAEALLECDVSLTPDAVYRIWGKYPEVEEIWQKHNKYDLVGSSGSRPLWDENSPRPWK